MGTRRFGSRVAAQGSNKRHTTSSFATRAMRPRNFCEKARCEMIEDAQGSNKRHTTSSFATRAMRPRNFCEKARCEVIEPHSCHRASDAAISARRRGTAVSITRDTRFHGVARRLPGSSPPPHPLQRDTRSNGVANRDNAYFAVVWFRRLHLVGRNPGTCGRRH